MMEALLAALRISWFSGATGVTDAVRLPAAQPGDLVVRYRIPRRATSRDSAPRHKGYGAARPRRRAECRGGADAARL